MTVLRDVGAACCVLFTSVLVAACGGPTTGTQEDFTFESHCLAVIAIGDAVMCMRPIYVRGQGVLCGMRVGMGGPAYCRPFEGTIRPAPHHLVRTDDSDYPRRPGQLGGFDVWDPTLRTAEPRRFEFDVDPTRTLFHEPGPFLLAPRMDACVLDGDDTYCVRHPSHSPDADEELRTHHVLVEGTDMVATGFANAAVYPSPDLATCISRTLPGRDDLDETHGDYDWYRGDCEGRNREHVAPITFHRQTVMGSQGVVVGDGQGQLLSISFDDQPSVAGDAGIDPVLGMAIAGDWLLVTNEHRAVWLNARTLEPRRPWVDSLATPEMR